MKEHEPSSVERFLEIAAKHGVRVVVEDSVPGTGTIIVPLPASAAASEGAGVSTPPTVDADDEARS